MSDQDHRFQHRWEIRRTEADLDSSSDDDHSRPNSASKTKQMKQKLGSAQNLEEKTQQTMQCPTSYTRGEKGKVAGLKNPNRKAEQPCKTRERKAKTKRTKKTTTNHELAADAALLDIRGHMKTLVEEIKTARRDLLAWMVKEMSSPSTDDIISAKPSGARKDQKQNTKRSETPKKVPNNRRKKSGKMIQNGEGGSIGRRSPPTNEKDSVPPKETENVFIDVLPIDKIEKQKGKRLRSSTKKQKTVEVEADQQSNSTVPAAADNYLMLPQKQVENTEQNPSDEGNEKDGGNRTVLNSGTSLSSHQLKFDPRPQQNDVSFTQNGMRSVSNYEQNTSLTMGNGNGHGFPFSMVPQGSNAGIGTPNIHNQFGLQYLSQGNRIPGMYREHPGFPSGFMGSYSGLNQLPKFNAQQSGVMGLQCPDIRRGGAFNQGNMTNQ